MDLTYLVVAVFGMCVLRPCRSMPTDDAAAAAPTPPTPSLQIAAAEPADNGKRSRTLFRTPPSPHHYHLLGGGGVDPYGDAANGLPLYVQQQQQQQQQLDQIIEENDLRSDVDDVDQDLRMSSRARPGKPDSPVYFIRLPPQPYVYMPGYGYVSEPTRLQLPPFSQQPQSPFLNLPLDFVSNGKPVRVYTLPQEQPDNQYQQPPPNRQKPHKRPQRPPAPPTRPPTVPPQQYQRPNSPVYNLDKGPYVFNGRPTDVFLLQNAYDNLYSEVLQNIYP